MEDFGGPDSGNTLRQECFGQRHNKKLSESGSVKDTLILQLTCSEHRERFTGVCGLPLDGFFPIGKYNFTLEVLSYRHWYPPHSRSAFNESSGTTEISKEICSHKSRNILCRWGLFGFRKSGALQHPPNVDTIKQTPKKATKHVQCTSKVFKQDSKDDLTFGPPKRY